jgi:hypothetical protein
MSLTRNGEEENNGEANEMGRIVRRRIDRIWLRRISAEVLYLSITLLWTAINPWVRATLWLALIRNGREVLVAKNHAQQGAMDLQFTVIVDEAQSSELIH